ncbi:MAG TPA: PQQ-binding-like beta-propeller repeat protein [Chryseolinea sp.]
MFGIRGMLFLLLLTIASCLPKAGGKTNWHSAHADSRNSDYSVVRGSKNITLAWEREFDGTINLGATNDTFGKVYVTTTGEGCHLYALDRKTGETVWCSAEIGKLAVASGALVDRQGNVYVADDKYMFAFDNAGKLNWKMPILGFPLSAQFTPSGRLLFITHIGVIYAMERETGRNVIEPYELTEGNSTRLAEIDPLACMRGTKNCPCANTPAIDPKTGQFYFTYWEPGAAQADLISMRYSETPSPHVSRMWRNASLPGGSASSPDISFDGKKIYVNDNHNGLHAIDAKSGKNIWRRNIGYATGGSPSTAPDGTIIPAGGARAPLICIKDAGDVALVQWRMDSVFNRGIATQTRGGLIYATINDRNRGKLFNSLMVIEASSGRVIDREELPGVTVFTVGTTVGPEGNVYVPAFNGKLFAFKPVH